MEQKEISEYFGGLGISYTNDLNEFDKTEYKKISESNPLLVERIDSVLQLIPSLLHKETLNSDTYRVIYDKGLGVLQKASKDHQGMFRANVVSANGKNNDVVAQALLEKTSELPNVISEVFSVTAMITAQYFMSQINFKLDYIQKKIDEIYKFLEDDKRSQIESAAKYLSDIHKIYQDIADDSSHKTAVLSTIQNIKMNASSNLIFYKNRITDIREGNYKKTKLMKICKKNNYYIEGYGLSLHLYAYSVFLEIIIGDKYSSNFIKNELDCIHGFSKEFAEKINIYNQFIEKKDAENTSIKNSLSETIDYLEALDPIPDISNPISFPKILSLVEKGGAKWYMTRKINKNKKKIEAVRHNSDEMERWINRNDENQVIKPINEIQNSLELLNAISVNRLELVKYKGNIYIKA